MFVDKVLVEVKAGDGGNGVVSFRREKFVDKGGPDGGDGGKGGDIILLASRNQDTLAAFRHQKRLEAEPGMSGAKRRKHGKSGQDLMVDVPIGTTVFNESGELIADLTKDNQQAVIALGGKGGFGNAHFKSSTRQAPKVAEKGEAGEGFTATLELKIIADAGLVGLPNAGKSTLLATISNAKPAIADYPFTTLTPNLGVVDIDEKTSVLIADIPGLIEGAAKGKGLGDEFLRHVERTAVLIHLIDAYNDDVTQAYKTIMEELKAYKTDLSKRRQLIVLTKIDGLDDEIVEAKLEELKAVAPAKTPLLAISAQSGQGVQPMLYELKKLLLKAKSQKPKAKEELPIIKLESDDNEWRVVEEDGFYGVVGRKIERFAERTDFSNPEGVARFRDIMRKMGILNELERKGINPGDKIRIGSHRITY